MKRFIPKDDDKQHMGLRIVEPVRKFRSGWQLVKVRIGDGVYEYIPRWRPPAPR